MNETLGKRIAQYRKEQSLTQENLAERLGLSSQAVSTPIKKAEIQMSTGVMYSPVRCRYYSDPPQFTLHAPIYRPWDYWVKMPLSLAVFAAVDVPCTLAANAVMLAGELVAYPFVAPFQQAVEPTEVKQVAEKE